MDILDFIRTNIGIVALRRHPNAELLHYTQVWKRSGNGDWSKYHICADCDDSQYPPGLLETIFSSYDPAALSYEDWW